MTEGQPALVKLDRQAADHLLDLGRRLASRRHRPSALELASADRTAIAAREAEPGIWEVTVRGAVGLVSFGDVRLLIEPKIPRTHLFYLFAKSEAVPRLDEDRAWMNAGQDLWELVATWYLRCAESVIRRDLVNDYLPFTDDLGVVRGTIDGPTTARDFYRGRTLFRCEFEEMGANTPLNRVLRAAAQKVARSPELPAALRARAVRVLARMDDVGELRPTDTRVRHDRRTAHYGDALALARHILDGERRIFEHGSHHAWTFLISTPDLVESGLRALLIEELPHRGVYARAGSIALGATQMRVYPDLVFAKPFAIGDVKYKLKKREWRRPDLYQAAAYAAAARTTDAAVLGFCAPHVESLPTVGVGDISVTAIDWIADPSRTPEYAAAALVGGVEEWLLGCDPSNAPYEPINSSAE